MPGSNLFRRCCCVAPILVAAAACAPALDWRELRLDDSGVGALLPCRPSVYSRRLVLAGAETTMTMRACSADGSTWAVARAEVADPARIDDALRALISSAAGNVGASELARRSWSPPGATPSAAAARARGSGRLPDGRPTELETAVFARGLHVIQATVVGPKTRSDAADMFFAGLRIGA